MASTVLALLHNSSSNNNNNTRVACDTLSVYTYINTTSLSLTQNTECNLGFLRYYVLHYGYCTLSHYYCAAFDCDIILHFEVMTA